MHSARIAAHHHEIAPFDPCEEVHGRRSIEVLVWAGKGVIPGGETRMEEFERPLATTDKGRLLLVFYDTRVGWMRSVPGSQERETVNEL